VQKVHDRAVAAQRAPETRQRREDLGVEVVGGTPAEFATVQRAEIARWRRVVQAGGITPD
jgi:tripartite-type tricarboxylate transporter receptor subunit TctC